MTGATSFLASAAVGSLLVVGIPTASPAQQSAARAVSSPIARLTSPAAPGTIAGVVRDDRGVAVPRVVVSALGAVTTVTVTDASGRFDFGSLTPGPYLVRAHLAGYVAPRAQMIQVRASARAVSAIALRREDAPKVLSAGIGITASSDAPPADAPSATPDITSAGDDSAQTESSDQTETAWRIRHARRSILKDATIPATLLAENDGADGSTASVLAQIAGTSRNVASFFADAPLTGQVNLLTAGSFDTPQQFFSTDTIARNVANIRIGAPAGSRADWTVAGALTQADISSWVLAGSYAMRAPAKHRYEVGLNYSTQRYEGGNPLALRDVRDGSRNVGAVYGYDSVSLSQEATVAFGAEYARYDYLNAKTLISPRVELTLTPTPSTRLMTSVSRRSQAPGAEEFLPPSDSGIWLPPQRTFSSLGPSGEFRAEHALTAAVALERDFGPTTLAVRTFRQYVDDQLVTVFGGSVPGQPTAKLGHYMVGNTGDIDTSGVSAEFRAVIASRIHGSIRYSYARGEILRAGSDYVMLLAPETARPGMVALQDVTGRIDAEVPETATRVEVAYRLGTGFAQAGSRRETPSRTGLDGRFDVQVHQSLPFMNFSNARWEMLLAVRNFFRDSSCDQSIYDELFVVRPPKRVVGGVTLHF
ncbi:MAG: TonB-dependent receptor [Vicinamibacterales bacterium]